MKKILLELLVLVLFFSIGCKKEENSSKIEGYYTKSQHCIIHEGYTQAIIEGNTFIDSIFIKKVDNKYEVYEIFDRLNKLQFYFVNDNGNLIIPSQFYEIKLPLEGIENGKYKNGTISLKYKIIDTYILDYEGVHETTDTFYFDDIYIKL